MTLYGYLENRFNSKTSYDNFFSFLCKYVRLQAMKEFVKQKRATMQYFCDIYGLSWAFSSVGCRHRKLNSHESSIYLAEPSVFNQLHWTGILPKQHSTHFFKYKKQRGAYKQILWQRLGQALSRAYGGGGSCVTSSIRGWGRSRLTCVRWVLLTREQAPFAVSFKN